MSRSKRRSKTQQARKKTPDKPGSAGVKGQTKFTRAAILALLLFVCGALIYIFYPTPLEDPRTKNPTSDNSVKPTWQTKSGLNMHWAIPDHLSQHLVQTNPTSSNIHPGDYVGPDACKECHKKNYNDWSNHPHRWMNALANESVVVGDFSGDAEIEYKGGKGTFYREDGSYRMRYERDDLDRVYAINQTIGSRFFQYYIGKGIEGPEPKDHDYYHADQVLPFGYWIDRKAWVPIVHVADELPDATRWDFLSLNLESRQVADPLLASALKARGVVLPNDQLQLRYATRCNYCHTTFPSADMFVRDDHHGQFMPARVHFSVSEYVANTHPELWDGSRDTSSIGKKEFVGLVNKMISFEAPEKAVMLGISCEACHLGCKDHVEEKADSPSFTAYSPFLYRQTEDQPIARGRTHDNVNWVCSRCHNGNRPTFAAGISTWNSTEFSDAVRGACYSELACVHCHNPHKTIGKKWPKTPEQDDASCLQCHEKYNDVASRQLHTHHPAGSSGDRCMNCHMPKINEGMQDVVRTHTIFSPTQKDMIEANHPNACNLCHLDKSIDWTVGYLKSWYGKEYSREKLAATYTDRNAAVGLGWLKHPDEAVRLVAADALARSGEKWALSDVIDILDDDYLLNRQFTQRALEERFDIKLDKKFGYWFYMTKKERREPVQRLRDGLLKTSQIGP